jgi:hypothetical protein
MVSPLRVRGSPVRGIRGTRPSFTDMGTPNPMSGAPIGDEGFIHAGKWRGPCRGRVRPSSQRYRASGSSMNRSTMKENDKLGDVALRSSCSLCRSGRACHLRRLRHPKNRPSPQESPTRIRKNKLQFQTLGGVAEWSKAAVLKTAVLARVPGVRIPSPPLNLQGISHHPVPNVSGATLRHSRPIHIATRGAC